jgi:hypothetical protein
MKACAFPIQTAENTDRNTEVTVRFFVLRYFRVFPWLILRGLKRYPLISKLTTFDQGPRLPVAFSYAAA